MNGKITVDLVAMLHELETMPPEDKARIPARTYQLMDALTMAVMTPMDKLDYMNHLAQDLGYVDAMDMVDHIYDERMRK